MRLSNPLRVLAVLGLPALLSGCNLVVLDPSGHVAVQEGRLIVIATMLMLLVIVPVIALTVLFAWKYRQGNTSAAYEPNWNHSTQLELVIWAAPLIIIIALGAITWITTHTLDPYRPLEHIDAKRPVPDDVAPLEVEVVALDWKWLFLYPTEGIAVVNELAAPVDRPIRFKLTASSVMNAFYIPALAGQIYAMPGMQTQLHAVINQPGVYDGISSNYSGAGFSGMRFKFHGLSEEDYDRWVLANRQSGAVLTRDAYLQLEKPSQREPVRRFASVAPGLYEAILNRCVEAGKMCLHDMMSIDAKGGGGRAGLGQGATIALPKGWNGLSIRTAASDVCAADDAQRSSFALSGGPIAAPRRTAVQ